MNIEGESPSNLKSKVIINKFKVAVYLESPSEKRTADLDNEG